MKAYVDANVFLFALLDSGEKGERATRLLNEVREGRVQGFTSALTLDEIFWGLIRNKKPHLLQLGADSVYALPGCTVLSVEADVPKLALTLMDGAKLKPRDAFHAVVMKLNGINLIFSDDADFDRVKEFTRKF